MFPVYEEKKENLHFRSKTSRHASPHLHNSIEFIYITEGTLELGMGQELYHMDKGGLCSNLSGCDSPLSGVFTRDKQRLVSVGRDDADRTVCRYSSEIMP